MHISVCSFGREEKRREKRASPSRKRHSCEVCFGLGEPQGPFMEVAMKTLHLLDEARSPNFTERPAE